MSGDGFPGVEWIPAHADRHTVKASRIIDEIVLHITEGGAVDARVTARNVIAQPRLVLANGKVQAQSSHYVVGRDGTVVQCVRHKDIAYHANEANAHTIGIEHNVRANVDKNLTGIQYWRSAQLVVWLGQQLGVPMDRYYIMGHSEIDPTTTHSKCPQRALDWATYMRAIADVQAAAEGRVSMTLWNWE